MLPDIAARWNVTMADFGCLAVDEILTFSTVVRSVRVATSYDEQTAAGEIFQIPGAMASEWVAGGRKYLARLFAVANMTGAPSDRRNHPQVPCRSTAD